MSEDPSASRQDREGASKLLDICLEGGEGDTVVVHSMDRLARNLDDLRRLLQTLTKRGIPIEFEGLDRVLGRVRRVDGIANTETSILLSTHKL